MREEGCNTAEETVKRWSQVAVFRMSVDRTGRLGMIAS
jgi:hypothetical protein